MAYRRWLAAILFLIAAPVSLLAQPVQQVPRDAHPIWFGPNNTWLDTPEEACRAMHAYFNPNAEYVQGEYAYPTYYNCKWILDADSNTVLPNSTFLTCSDGLGASSEGLCLRTRDREPPCDCTDGSTPVNDIPQPRVGNPVALDYATKVEQETDYGTEDGRFIVRREYRSRHRSFQHRAASTEIAGFGEHWHGLIPGRLTAFGTYMDYIEYLSPQGTTVNFRVDPAQEWVFNRHGERNRHRLSVPTVPPVDRYQFFRVQSSVANGPAEFRMETSKGEYTLFRRSGSYMAGEQIRYMIPIEKGFPDGYKIFYDYTDTGEFPNVVRDSFGRQMTLTWQEVKQNIVVIGEAGINGRPPQKVISQIVLPDATKLIYTYGYANNMSRIPVKNRLDRVERQSATGTILWARDYLHENADYQWAITGKRDQNGNRLSTYGYDVAGLVNLTERAGGVERYTITNLEDPTPTDVRYRQVINPLGRRTDYVFHGWLGAPWTPQRLQSITGFATSTVPADSQTFTYYGYIGDYSTATAVDKKGRTLSFGNDSGLRPTSITDASGTGEARATAMQWHPVFDLPTQEERPGLRINNVYGPTGLLLTRTETDTTTHSLPYSTNGQTRTTTYTWNGAGRLASINGPKPVTGGKDDTLTFTYHATNGNLLTSTNGLGQVTTFAAHDANGRPGTMTDPNAIVTAFTYDALGRTTAINVKHPTTAASDAITTLEYDVEGRVIGITAPATDKLIIDYNLAGQLTAIRAASGERIDYVNNAMGGVTSETVKRTNGTTASQITRTFDELNRMLTETLGPNRTTSWAYDKEDNPTLVTSARNHATQMAFDGLDRLVGTVAPDTGTTATGYTVWDDVASHTDAANVQTVFVRNGFGEVIQEVSPDRGTSTYTYNAGGELVSATDGRGQVVNYTRDILGRALTKTPVGRPASEIVTYTYDTAGLGSYKIGRLMRVVDGSGTTQFQYDHRGNLLVKRQSVGSTAAANLTYAYNLADRITQITYPSGRQVLYTRDAKQRITQVRTRATSTAMLVTLMSSMQYEPFAALKQGTYGNTLSFTANFGNDGRLASRRVYKTSGGANVSLLNYAYDDTDNMTGIADAVVPARSTTYAYDNVERLNRVDGNLAGGMKREDYSHDKNGNRTSVERRLNATDTTPAQTDTYTTTPGTNRLASVTTAAGTRSIAYDNRGNTASETRPASVTVTASYDGYARLTGYMQGGTNLTHAYNGLDDRVATTSGGSTLRFVFDPSGRVIGEYGTSATDVKAEYLWLQPEAGDSGSYGGDDGTGGYTPIAISQAPTSGTATLSWVHANHLGVPLTFTNASGTEVTLTGFTALGFPGQTKTLADLWYNRYRDYDPTTGRYIQADPIGFEGDANPYGYAAANPLKNIDPEGLDAAAVGRVAFDWWLDRQFRPGRNTPWGRAWGVGEAIGAAAAVGIFVCLRESSDGEPERCRKVIRKCQEICNDRYAEDRTKLPGTGRDWKGRLRRCVRECAEAHGCGKYY